MKENKAFHYVNDEENSKTKTSFRISPSTETATKTNYQKIISHQEDHRLSNKNDKGISIITNILPTKSLSHQYSIEIKSSNSKLEKNKENDGVKLLKYQIEKVKKYLLFLNYFIGYSGNKSL